MRNAHETTVYTKYRWFILFLLVELAVAQSVVMIAPAPFMGEISIALAVDLGAVTAATMAVFTLSLALGSIVGGVFIDKFGSVRAFFIGLLCMSVGSLLIPVIGDSLGTIVFLRVLQGFGAGPINSAVTKIAADWFPVNERGMVAGMQGMAISLGVAIGFIVAPGIFASTGDWRMALASGTIFCVIGFVLTF